MTLDKSVSVFDPWITGLSPTLVTTMFSHMTLVLVSFGSRLGSDLNKFGYKIKKKKCLKLCKFGSIQI